MAFKARDSYLTLAAVAPGSWRFAFSTLVDIQRAINNNDQNKFSIQSYTISIVHRKVFFDNTEKLFIITVLFHTALDFAGD